ncbi:hypothetical protein RhiirC2_858354 [Rhizophagus irregularis]|uniref:Uncharacterized protein n=1 Tax=Rhizophagus irregularis TaxID=588596 RepID=A0A2N1M617_9GLOM|nr:hypothetical protein RhiirC2_858354 [Rhizophagus irregularis]
MNSDNVSSSDKSSSSSSSSSSSFFSSSSSFSKSSYNTIKAKVFIWSDSELKDVYSINYELTWAEQKDNIVTKLLPPLYKLVNKKYKVSNSDLLKMLYGRWRSRHYVSNIIKQGEAQIKRNKRRAMKNSRMHDKKKRRTNMANYLIQNKDKYICQYPEKDLVQILKDSGYHSEKWEETDEDDEDDENDEEVVTKKNSIYIYERWWRSPALQRLLHDRIDPTVELLRKKPPNLKCKRVLDKTETANSATLPKSDEVPQDTMNNLK